MFIGMAGYAVEQSEENPLQLKDGSHLYISDDYTMRMVDKDGKPIEMKDGVEMELEDGTLIMMKNKKIWRHDHRKMKNL
jgi:tRNA splicing endonuclease